MDGMLFLSQSSTKGAEKIAPPGIGRSPMIAGRRATAIFCLTLSRTDSTRSFIKPLSDIWELRIIIKVITVINNTLFAEFKEFLIAVRVVENGTSQAIGMKRAPIIIGIWRCLKKRLNVIITSSEIITINDTGIFIEWGEGGGSNWTFRNQLLTLDF